MGVCFSGSSTMQTGDENPRTVSPLRMHPELALSDQSGSWTPRTESEEKIEKDNSKLLVAEIEKCFLDATVYAAPDNPHAVALELKSEDHFQDFLGCISNLFRQVNRIGRLSITSGEMNQRLSQEFGQSLRFNSNLQEIRFIGTKICPRGMVPILQGIGESRSLEIVTFENVDMNEEATLALVTVLLTRNRLRQLKITEVAFTERAVNAIIAALQSNYYLEVVELSFLTETQTSQIFEVLARNRAIQEAIKEIISLEQRRSSISPKRSLPDINYSRTEEYLDPQATIAGRAFDMGFADKIGRRNQMEDVTLVKTVFRNHFDEHLFCVFDGHGGYQCSRFIGYNFARVFEEVLNAADVDHSTDLPAATEEALFETFRRLDQMCKDYAVPHGTCALVIYIKGNKLFSASVGDSQGFITTNGVTKSIAKVYRPTDESEKERIQTCGGFVALNGRVGGVLAVSRSLGDVAYQPFVSAVPAVQCHQLTEKDELFFLGCDGVWDVTDYDTISNLVIQNKDAQDAAGKACLLAYALGSTDNISTIAVKFK